MLDNFQNIPLMRMSKMMTRLEIFSEISSTHHGILLIQRNSTEVILVKWVKMYFNERSINGCCSVLREKFIFFIRICL